MTRLHRLVLVLLVWQMSFSLATCDDNHEQELEAYRKDEFFIDKPGGTLFSVNEADEQSPGFMIGARIAQIEKNKIHSVAFDLSLEMVWMWYLSQGPQKKTYGQWHKQMNFEKYHFVSGHRQLNDVVPLFGVPYKITKIDRKAGHRGGQVDLTLTKVVDKNMVESLTTDPYAHIIMNEGNFKHEYGNTVKVNFDYEIEAFILKFQHVKISSENLKPEFVIKKSEMIASLGTDINLTDGVNTYSYRIISIVRPDKSANIPGWIGIRRCWPEIVPFGVTNSPE